MAQNTQNTAERTLRHAFDNTLPIKQRASLLDELRCPPLHHGTLAALLRSRAIEALRRKCQVEVRRTDQMPQIMLTAIVTAPAIEA